jgi:hypothetical protein
VMIVDRLPTWIWIAAASFTAGALIAAVFS